MFEALMQRREMLVSHILTHAATCHGDTEIVSRRVEGDIHRQTYAQTERRAARLARGLDAMRIERGDRVATLAWNGYRHVEAYYGVSGSGRVLHTVNPRLHPDQIAWIVNHAGDRIVLFDLTFAPIVTRIAAQCPSVAHWIALCDALPDALRDELAGVHCYEEWLAAQRDDYAWPEFDEDVAAAICYTSGTVGNPKGVVYSHRSSTLHALNLAMPDCACLSASDSVLPVVPMFHVNAWGAVYAAPMAGCKLVLPGPALDGASLFGLMDAEDVTLSISVPTIWLGLLTQMEREGRKPRALARVVVGGAAAPESMIRRFEQDWSVDFRHGWGMTESSPLATIASLKARHAQLDTDGRMRLKATQGRPVFGVQLRLQDDDGAALPWDGRSIGEIALKGHWVASGYFDSGKPNPTRDGWLPTGDLGTIDPDGYVHLVDRSKDVIKSGGEWVSSIDIENIAMAHPAVAMAACVAKPDEKWGERPLLVVVRKGPVEAAEILACYTDKMAKWAIPDEVRFVDQIPLGATGKMLKRKLREDLGLVGA